jgi:hypothetical protein
VDELTEQVERMRPQQAARIVNLRTLMEQDIAEKGVPAPYAAWC